MDVTFSKQWIHLRLSDLWPPTSTILQQETLTWLLLLLLLVTLVLPNCILNARIRDRTLHFQIIQSLGMKKNINFSIWCFQILENYTSYKRLRKKNPDLRMFFLYYSTTFEGKYNGFQIIKPSSPMKNIDKNPEICLQITIQIVQS